MSSSVCYEELSRLISLAILTQNLRDISSNIWSEMYLVGLTTKKSGRMQRKGNVDARIPEIWAAIGVVRICRQSHTFRFEPALFMRIIQLPFEVWVGLYYDMEYASSSSLFLVFVLAKRHFTLHFNRRLLGQAEYRMAMEWCLDTGIWSHPPCAVSALSMKETAREIGNF